MVRPVLAALLLVLHAGYVVGYAFVQPPGSSSRWPSPRLACPWTQPRTGPSVAGPRAAGLVVASAASAAVGVKKGAPVPAPQYGDTQGAEIYADHVSVAAGANRLISDG